MKKAVFFLFFLIFSSFLTAADELNFKFSAAVQAGDVKLAAELLRSGADINYVDEDWPLFVGSIRVCFCLFRRVRVSDKKFRLCRSTA